MAANMLAALAASLAAAPCWLPPASPLALSHMLAGRWTLRKTFDYVRGGKPGSYDGVASFSALTWPESSPMLAYHEEGVATLGSGQDPIENFAATRRLLYDCSGERTVRVLFDDLGDDERGSAARVIDAARYFHSIELSAARAPPAFDHPCGPDMYTGRLLLEGADSFTLLWSVTGPRKLGTVAARYRRL